MQETLFDLPVIHQISPSLSERKKEALSLLVADHPQFRAVVALQGAQLLAWQPSGCAPVVWLSQQTAFSTSKAIRGGIPVCWPWFGSAGIPAHGFARNQLWTLLAHDEDALGVSLTFELTATPETRAIWPHDFTLILRMRLAQECSLELEVWGDFASTAALHSYFQVADIAEVSVSGLGDHYIDKTEGNQSAIAAGAQRYRGTVVDRIFTSPENVSVIEDKQGQRWIEIYHQHQSDVVTWNPGPELSASMADMADNGYRTMVCVETARIQRPLVSKPEQPARLSMLVRINQQ